jgi:hypothetical protein
VGRSPLSSLNYSPARGWSKSGCHFDPIKWQDKSPKKGVKKALFTAKKPQGEVEIGAAPFRCGLITYHLKHDSFLS